MPTIEDVLTQLRGAKVFSTADWKHGFWHCLLDRESSLLTAFETPLGRFIWRRLPFGVSVAPELFQAKVHQALEGLRGVFCVADDLLIAGFGDTTEEADADHDRNLLALLQRCREKGIKLNANKLRLRRQVTTFLGHELTVKGIRPDPRKVDAIMKMPKPTDKPGVRRLLGMATYLSMYCAKFSEVTAPLRELLREDNAFLWTDRHDEAFSRLCSMLSAPPVLQFYDVTKPVTVQTDCSQRGIGSVVLQEGKPVEYGSRSLTECEQNYAQIERELLAILFALEKFHTYVYGRNDVVVVTDHKPLVAIHKKALASAPKRLQPMLLRLQRYSYKLVYQPGSQLQIADTLSRAFPPSDPPPAMSFHDLASIEQADSQQLDELQMIASAETLDLINNAAKVDAEYQQLVSQIQVGWPPSKVEIRDPALRQYFTFADELTVCGGLVFKGHRLVVPQPARATVLERLHRAHIGLNGILRRARDIVYYPGLSADIKRIAERCDVCARFQQ